MIVTVTAALVTVLVSVTETVMDVVTVDGLALPSVAETAPAGLGVDISLSILVTLGNGRSLSIPGILGVGMSFPTSVTLGLGTSFPIAGTLGAAASFPMSLSLSFRGDRTDPEEPRTERGTSLMFGNSRIANVMTLVVLVEIEANDAGCMIEVFETQDGNAL